MISSKDRNINIDLAKCVAIASVIAVHFFYNGGFYDTSLHGIWGAVAVTLRTSFMVCVPLFLIVTGYLMMNKSFGKKYFVGILRTVTIYIFASLLCVSFRIAYLGEDLSAIDVVLSLLDYSGCGYAWYVEMYIGLFLLIPFLNLVFKGLGTKRRQQGLLAVLVVLVSLPPVVNYEVQILPAWWSGSLYPAMYYFIGSYLREYGLQCRTGCLFAVLLGWIVICSAFNYYLCINSKDNLFGWHSWTGWGSLQNMVSATLVFALIQRARLESVNPPLRSLIVRISKYSLGMYLASWICDKALYPVYGEVIGPFQALLPFFPLVVPCQFICSLALSAVVTELSERVAIPLERQIKSRLTPDLTQRRR